MLIMLDAVAPNGSDAESATDDEATKPKANRWLSILPLMVMTVVWGLAVMPFDLVYAATREGPPSAIRSASEPDYPPFSIVREDGTADGFSVDLLKAVVDAVGMTVRIETGTWHTLKKMLAEGRLNVLPLVSYSRERDRVYDFSAPYLRMHGTIFVRRNERDRDWRSLKDKEVLVMRGDTAHEYAVANQLSDHLVLTDTYEAAMRLIANGRHDAVLVQQLVGWQLIKHLGIDNVVALGGVEETSLKPAEGPLTGFQQKFCLAVKEGDKELLARLNEGLAIVITNGTYDALYDKWFGPILPEPAVPFTMVLEYVLYALIPMVLLLSLGGVWYLKQEVSRKTRHLEAEIRDHQKTQDELKYSERILSLRNRIAHIIAVVPDEQMYTDTLDVLREATGSRYGVFAHIDDKGDAVAPSMTTEVWDECRVIEKKIRYPHDTWEDSLWARAISEKKSLIRNTPGRVPDGHVAVENTLIVPMLCKGDVIGHFMLSNRDGGYGDREKQLVEDVAEYIAPILKARLDRDSHDIKRARAEKELKSSEEQFRLLVESAPEPIAVVVDGRFAYLNRAAWEMLGAEGPDWLLGRPVIDQFTPVNRDDVWEQIRSTVMDQMALSRIETTCLKVSGEPLDIEISAIPFQYRGKAAALAFARDMSERKKAEAQLERLAQQRKLALDAAEMGWWHYDPSTGTASWDDRYREIFGVDGYSRPNEEILVLLHPDDLPGVLAKVEAALNPLDPKPFAAQYRVNRKDGTTRWVSANGLAEFQGRGDRRKAVRFVGTVADITERKRTEFALKESEASYRGIFQNAVVGFYQSTPGGRFVQVNPTFARILGYASPKEVVAGIASLEQQYYVNPDDRRRYLETMQRSGTVEGLEVEVRRKNGGTVWISQYGRVVYDEKGKIAHHEGFIKDISERRLAEKEKEKLERQLRQAQKMEAIGTLAGGIAHDFNNILSAVIGFSELALDDAAPGTPLAENLKGVLAAGSRAKNLVHQILTFSRQADQEKQLFKVQPIVKEALKLLRSSIPKTIEIRQDLDPRCDPIFADPTQVHQVVMNLATNAFHAMEQHGGTLTVALKQVEMDRELFPGAMSESYARLSVIDTGAGITPGAIERIFDPYYSTKGQRKGTGLGLAVVQGIVKSAGGDIRVYSEPGKGTAFHVYLPVEKSDTDTENAPAIQDKAPGGTESILLVDDEAAIVQIETRMLERLGYRVESRTSSVEALQAFSQNPASYDLVITDMTMPNLPGHRLAEKIQAIKPHQPIIICTGFSEWIGKKKAAEMGINGFLMKPVVKSELARMVRKALDGGEPKVGSTHK